MVSSTCPHLRYFEYPDRARSPIARKLRKATFKPADSLAAKCTAHLPALLRNRIPVKEGFSCANTPFVCSDQVRNRSGVVIALQLDSNAFLSVCVKVSLVIRKLSAQINRSSFFTRQLSGYAAADHVISPCAARPGAQATPARVTLIQKSSISVARCRRAQLKVMVFLQLRAELWIRRLSGWLHCAVHPTPDKPSPPLVKSQPECTRKRHN